MPSKTLQGKIAIVTGGSRGIGAAIAVELARRGAQGVVITYTTNKSKADEVFSLIKTQGSEAVAVQADLRDPNFGNIVIQGALKGLNATEIDILVNNAAIAEYPPLSTVDDALFAKLFEANVRGPLSAMQAALPVLRRGGRIINVSSRAARVPVPGTLSLYAATKAALEALTKGVATEYSAEKGVTVNNVSPGPVATDALSSFPQQMLDHLANGAVAEKRLGTTDDVAQVVGFLAEEGSRWINGETIQVAGGMDML